MFGNWFALNPLFVLVQMFFHEQTVLFFMFYLRFTFIETTLL